MSLEQLEKQEKRRDAVIDLTVVSVVAVASFCLAKVLFDRMQ